jgi:hypothetical protein
MTDTDLKTQGISFLYAVSFHGSCSSQIKFPLDPSFRLDTRCLYTENGTQVQSVSVQRVGGGGGGVCVCVCG